MAEALVDTVERAQLCDTLNELGPDAPTLLEPWTTRDLAAHLALREHDFLAGPGLVLPGPWRRFAERRQAALALRDFSWLVTSIRSEPKGFFSIGWVRRFPSLNGNLRPPRGRPQSEWSWTSNQRSRDGRSTLGQRSSLYLVPGAAAAGGRT